MSMLNEYQQAQFSTYLKDFIHQDSTPGQPACVLDILSLEASPTPEPGCQASLATLQYEIHDTQGLTHLSAPPSPVQHSVCYGAKEAVDTDNEAIQGVLIKFVKSLGM